MPEWRKISANGLPNEGRSPKIRSSDGCEGDAGRAMSLQGEKSSILGHRKFLFLFDWILWPFSAVQAVINWREI